MKIKKTYSPLKCQFIVLCILSFTIIKPTFQIIASFSSEIESIEINDSIDLGDEVLICCHINSNTSEDKSKGIGLSKHIKSLYVDIYSNILIPPPK